MDAELPLLVNATIARLQSQANGFKFTATDAIAMLQLCSYETHALGYSAFCDLFSEVQLLTAPSSQTH